MLNHVLRRVLALVLTGFALALPGAASADVLIGCKNKTNGNVRVVADAALCRESEVAISWNSTGEQGPAGPAGTGVRTIAGIDNADGTKHPVTPNGFTPVRLSPGRYQISFPPGTWTSFPVVTVTPFGANGAFGNAIVSSAIGFGDGSAQFVIDMTIANAPAGAYFDNAFMFIAVQSQ